MRSTTHHLSVSTARADALFVSALQRSEEPSAAQVRQAIATAIREFGARGCAAQVAQAYGEHPETAVLRMRWARAAVQGHGMTEKAGDVNDDRAAREAPGRSFTPACCAA